MRNKTYLLLLLVQLSYGQFSSLLSYQAVTESDAAGAGFILKSGQSHGSGTKCMTKDEANTKYDLNTSIQSGVDGNQLLQKDKWQTPLTVYTYYFNPTTLLNAEDACLLSDGTTPYYSTSSTMIVGSILYSDSALTTIVNTLLYYIKCTNGKVYQTDEFGVINNIYTCPPPSITAYVDNELWTDLGESCDYGNASTLVYTTAGLSMGSYVYMDNMLTTPFYTSGYYSFAGGGSIKTNASGEIVVIDSCP